MSKGRSKRKRANLYAKQRGKCFWCGLDMLLFDPLEGIGRPPLNLATLDHLDEKGTGRRGLFQDKNIRRTVLACWKCNQDRSTVHDEWLAGNRMTGTGCIWLKEEAA